MLKQTQKKIMSVKDFTNRLTFLSNALEACARAYDNDVPAGKVKRRETREGFGMLVFLPPKPADDHMKLHDNIVCHWHYRNVLSKLKEQESAAALELEAAKDLVTQAQEEAANASEAYSRAKQLLNNPSPETEDLVEKARLDHEYRKSALSEARNVHAIKRDALEGIQKRIASCQKELDKLWKERQKAAKGKEPAEDYARFAKDTLELNGVDVSHLSPDASDPACFDGIIGLPCRAKEATPTDISRLRTDSSNSTILNEFVLSNMVVSPKFAAAGFPACRTSLVRDTEPEFSEAIMAAAARRVLALVLEPELEFGEYSAEERTKLAQHLGSGPLPNKGNRTNLEAESNILYEAITSDAFPVMVEEMLKPAVVEALSRFGDESACENFTRKLTVLSFNEQTAREKHARAYDRLSDDIAECYAARLKARCEIMAFLLCVSLLGSAAVDSYEVDMSKIAELVTGKPNLRPRARKEREVKTQFLIVEQIPNADGSFSFGKEFALEEGSPILIGRAPFGDKLKRIIVPAGRVPYPGLIDFAANVSRAHALLEPKDGKWYLSDAGSSYGTALKRHSNAGQEPQTSLLVDDEQIPLQNGDVIVLAPREIDGRYDIDAELGFSYRFEVLS